MKTMTVRDLIEAVDKQQVPLDTPIAMEGSDDGEQIVLGLTSVKRKTKYRGVLLSCKFEKGLLR